MSRRLFLQRQDGHEFPLGAKISLGRTEDNDIVVNDSRVSRHHATIWFSQGQYWIRDEGSTNGTFVNEQRIQREQTLNVGDRVWIGGTTLELKEEVGESVKTIVARPTFAPIRRPKTGPIILLAGGGAALLLVVVVLFSSAADSGIPEPTRIAQYALTSSARTPSATPTEVPPTPTVTPTPTDTPTPTPTATPTFCVECGRQQALSAVVQIFSPNDEWIGLSFGSGSFVSSSGHILTNFHVVGNPATGRLDNQRGLIFVAINTKADAPPVVTYIAELVAKDVDLDLALIRVVRSSARLKEFPLPVTRNNIGMALDVLRRAANEGGEPTAVGLRFLTVPIGDAEKLNPGDRITTLGFPGIGGETVTLTQGTVSGFLAEGRLSRAWIKTDTEINPGNSGGMALSERWELIGVPSRATERVGGSGKIGLIRSITTAKTLLGMAR